jgi:sugar (pentulose or hexulose) kinase
VIADEEPNRESRFLQSPAQVAHLAMCLGKMGLEDVPAAVAVTRTFEPDPAAQLVYELMYAEFKRFYGALHGSYSRLNR